MHEAREADASPFVVKRDLAAAFCEIRNLPIAPCHRTLENIRGPPLFLLQIDSSSFSSSFSRHMILTDVGIVSSSMCNIGEFWSVLGMHTASAIAQALIRTSHLNKIPQLPFALPSFVSYGHNNNDECAPLMIRQPHGQASLYMT